MSPFETWSLEAFGTRRSIEPTAFISTPFELCCTLRGFFHRALLDRTDLDSWLFVDGDVFIAGELTPVFEEIERGSITLSRHARTPAYPKHRPIPETEFLSGGIYNGGVLGLKRDANTEAFVNWFLERLRLHAIAVPPLFVDQLWLNLVPGLFEGVQTFEHPGVNVGHWNLHEVAIETRGDTVTANGAPLLLAHFSGADPKRPDVVSEHAPCSMVRGARWVADLFERYRNGLPTTDSAIEYGHASLPNRQEDRLSTDGATARNSLRAVRLTEAPSTVLWAGATAPGTG